MTRKLRLLAVACAMLGGCSFHASMNAGTRAGSQSELGRSQTRSASAGSEAQQKERPSEEKLATRSEPLRAAAEEPVSEQPKAATPAAEPPRKPAASTKTSASDRDRGHGNDADGVDEDNPGKSKADRTIASADKKRGDHDRGHGNDADRVDEDNPGKSKGGKGK